MARREEAANGKVDRCRFNAPTGAARLFPVRTSMQDRSRSLFDSISPGIHAEDGNPAHPKNLGRFTGLLAVSA